MPLSQAGFWDLAISIFEIRPFELVFVFTFQTSTRGGPTPSAGLLHEYMGQKRRKCPKKRVSSLWQLRSQRGLPGRTARAFGALPGTQGVRLTDQTE